MQSRCQLPGQLAPYLEQPLPDSGRQLREDEVRLAMGIFEEARGELLLEITTRMRWPRWKTSDVGYISMVNS